MAKKKTPKSSIQVSPSGRAELSRQRKEGESYEDMLKRKGLIRR